MFADIYSAFAALLLSCSARGQDLFTAASQQYFSANYKQAADKYEDLIKTGQWNAPAFYNLGNTYFQLHDFGRAILNYERALALEPNHPEAQTNISVAREEAHALELQPDWREQIQRFASGLTNSLSWHAELFGSEFSCLPRLRARHGIDVCSLPDSSF